MEKISISDLDADGKLLHQFDVELQSLPDTVEGLVRDRVVEDLQRIEPDFPEHHIALVQPLRSREVGDEIELFTPAVVDMAAQLKAAFDGFRQGDYAVVVGSKTYGNLADEIDLESDPDVQFIRFNLVIGG